MKRLILALLATAVATPAVAQHTGHNMPGMTMPTPEKKAAPKKPAKKAAKKAKKGVEKAKKGVLVSCTSTPPLFLEPALPVKEVRQIRRPSARRRAREYRTAQLLARATAGNAHDPSRRGKLPCVRSREL